MRRLCEAKRRMSEGLYLEDLVGRPATRERIEVKGEFAFTVDDHLTNTESGHFSGKQELRYERPLLQLLFILFPPPPTQETYSTRERVPTVNQVSPPRFRGFGMTLAWLRP